MRITHRTYGRSFYGDVFADNVVPYMLGYGRAMVAALHA